MKFKKYIVEGSLLNMDDVGAFNHVVQKYCKPYLKLIKGNNPLVRGMSVANRVWGNISNGEKETRKDRIPSKTHKFIFEKTNKWLLKNGHNSRKESIICTSNKDWAITFNRHNVYYVFPKGDISYTWMDAKDFNLTDDRTGWYSDAADNFFTIDDFDTAYEVKMYKPFADYFHTDKGFSHAYKKGYEFWINSKTYYFFHTNETDYTWNKTKGIFE